MALIKMNGVNYWGSAYGQGIIAPMIYSDEEREVGVWRDGKPLYQRVFDLGSDVLISPNNFTNTSIDASQMQTLVDAWGIYSTGVTKYSLMANISNNIIRLQTDRNGASANVRYAVLQYTKTTDTAGSGTYTPSKALAVHYSTTEQVIGTWIDGKPLYEKTIHSGALTKDTNWHTINHGISNLSEFIKMSGIANYSGEWYEIGTFRPVSNTGIMLYGTISAVGYMNNYQAMTDSYITLQYTKTTD